MSILPDAPLSPEPEQFGHVAIARDTGEVWIDGKLISLTPIEVRLLYCLLRNRGRVVSTDQLAHYADIYKWGIKSHLTHVRQKTGVTIKSAPKFGYRIDA